MRDLAVHAMKVDDVLVILNTYIDDVLVCIKSPIIKTKGINRLKIYFILAQKKGAKLKHLNCRIIQFKIHISMDQTSNRPHYENNRRAHQKSKIFIDGRSISN